jgi:hypothetical protein
LEIKQEQEVKRKEAEEAAKRKVSLAAMAWLVDLTIL